MRLDELQRHGDEIKQVVDSRSDLITRCAQLEHQIHLKEEEVERLQRRCHELVEKVRMVKSHLVRLTRI